MIIERAEMKLEVTAKQPNSKMCFVCGINNEFGLNSRFYELENQEIAALFTPRKQHQGYPGRVHGGIAATILDETIGRAIMVNKSHNIWGVTIDFSMRCKKPIPIGEEIHVRARVTRNTRRIFEGSGEILLADGSPAIEATGKYMKMDINKITQEDFINESWEVLSEPSDPLNVATFAR